MRSKIKQILLTLSIFFLSTAIACAATEFVCSIKAAGGGDYSTLASWDSDVAGDLTLSSVMVFSYDFSQSSGNIYHNNSVQGASSGATGTAVFVTPTQILITGISGTFSNGENVWNTSDHSTFVKITNAGDSPICVAEMYNQEQETATVSLSGNWVTSALNYVEIRPGSGKRHTGIVGVTGVGGIKLTGTTVGQSLLHSGTQYLSLKNLYLESTSTSTADLLVFDTNSTLVTISGCLINKSSNSASGNLILVSQGVLKARSNFMITSNTDSASAAINLASTVSLPCYIHANTIYSHGTTSKALINASAQIVYLKNNIFFGFPNPPFINNGGGSIDKQYNAFDSAYNAGATNILNLSGSDHLTVLTTNSEDLHLKTTSALRGYGLSLLTNSQLAVTTDIDAQPRASWDIGGDDVGGPFTITSPNGTESWKVGTAQNITWTYIGPATPLAITNVKLSYSLNGGSDNYPYIITDSTSVGTSNSGAYSWTIPDAISSNVKLRIEDVNNSPANAVSGAFTITIPTLTITAPNGSELWYPNEAKNITWTSSGTIADALTLQYSTDSGSTYPNTINPTVIANSPQTYSWTLPFASTSGDVTTAKVKILEAYSRYFKDDSAYDFNLTGSGNLSNTVVSGTGLITGGVTLLQNVSPPTTKTDYATGTNSGYGGGVAFDNVTNSVWVANWGGNTVSKINISTGVTTNYVTGVNPRGVAFDNVTNSVWVGYNGNVSKFNISTGAKIIDYPTGTAYGVAFDNVTNSVWVANYASANVSKINISTGVTTNYATGTNPVGVAFDNVTNSVWVANSGSNNVSKFNISTGAKIIDYPTGTNPYGVAFDNVTNSVWVANWGGNTVSKINISTGAKIDYATGSGPRGVAFDNVTNSVWVTNWGDNTVSKIRVSDGQLMGSYATGAKPWGVAFDNVTNSVWVANYDSNTVSKIAVLRYSPSGTYTSRVFDAGASPGGWGTVSWNGTNILPLGGNWATLGGPGTGTGTNQLFSPWPVFVDSVNNKVYTINWGNDTLVKFDSGGNSQTIPLDPTGQSNHWKTIAGAAGGGAGGLFVDTVNNQVYTANRNWQNITKFDSGDGPNTLNTLGSHLQVFGNQGAGTNQFNTPQSIYVDVNNAKVYVADTYNQRVCKFDSGGAGAIPTSNNNWETLGSSASSGTGTGQFGTGGGVNGPTAVFVDTLNSKVYVFDRYNARLTKFDSGGNTFGAFQACTNWSTLGSGGSGVNQFSLVFGFSLDISNNKVYVASMSSRIYKFDSGGAGPLTTSNNWETFGSSGTGVGEFGDFRGISVDSTNNKVYTADMSNNRIAKFDSGGVTNIFTLQARTGANTSMTGATTWTTLTSGQALPAGAGTGRYLQYLATISTSNPSVSPFLDNITFNYSSGATTISDASDANFSIKQPKLSFTTQPASTGTPGVAFSCAVSIQKQTADGGATIPTDNSTVITLAVAGGTGTLSGTTIETVSNGVATFPQLYYSKPETISLTATSSPTAISTTSSPATSFGQALTLTAPVGGESYTVGSPQTITWTDSKGIVSNVKLSYSTNAGTSYDYIITDSAPDTGTYSWTVPDAVSNTVRVKVEDANAANSYSTSGSNFAITTPTLRLTLPNGGERWYPRDVDNITWTSSGTISNTLKLEYTIDGLNWKPISNVLTLNNDSSLVGYWRFDEGSGTTVADSSGNGNTGTISGATWVDGKFGKALSFNGVNNYVNIPNSTSLNPFATSLEAWFKMPDYARNTYAHLIFKGGGVETSQGCGAAYSLAINTYGSSPISQAFFSIKGGSCCQGFGSTPNLSLNTWYHMAATYNSITGEVKLYLNGGLLATWNALGQLNISSNDLRINSNNFNGVIDEVAIYNRVLSAQEISQHYNGGLGLGFSSQYSGSYPWVVPFDVSDTAKVKISEAYTRYFKDDSAYDFGLGANSGTAVSAGLTTGGVTLLQNVVPPTTKIDFPVGANPYGIAFDNVTNSVWVVNRNSAGTVSKVNIFTGAKTDYPTTSIGGSYPQGIAFDNVTNSVWVAGNFSSGVNYGVNKININNPTIKTDYATGSQPTAVAFDNVTNSVWVTNNVSNTVSKINISTGAKTDYATGVRPCGIAFDNVTNFVWVVNQNSNTVSKINIYNPTMKADYPTGATPLGIAFDNVTNSVWVTNLNSYTVSKINIYNPNIKTDYPVGSSSYAVAFDNVTNSVWATQWSGTVRKFNINDPTIKTDYATGGSGVDGIAFDNVTSSIWVANSGSGTVSKISVLAYSTSTPGTYTSRVFDAGATSTWGTANWQGTNILTFGNTSNWQPLGGPGTGAGTGQFSAPSEVCADASNKRIYVVDANNNRICKFDSGQGGTTLGANWYTVGGGGVNTSSIGSGGGNYYFNLPMGVFVDSGNNKVYVSDYYNGVARFDSGEGATTLGGNWARITQEVVGGTTYVFGAYAAGGRGGKVSVDVTNGKVYLATICPPGLIFKFDSGTSPTTQFGANPQGPVTSSLNNPNGISVDTINNKVYVMAKFASPYIAQFDSGESGTTLGNNFATFGSVGSGSYQFTKSSVGYSDICVDASNNKLYVVDTGNNRICRFNSGGSGALTTTNNNWQTFPATGTGSGAGIGQFNIPSGIFVDAVNNKTYVADTNNNRICSFDSGGGINTFTLQARTGATTSACQTASWSPALVNGATLSGAGTGEYLQYLVTMSTGNPNVSPFLDNITFNYDSSTTISDTSDSNFYITQPQIVFAIQPGGIQIPNNPFSCTVTMQRQDSSILSLDNTTQITLGVNVGTGILSGATTATVVNGVAVFGQLYYNKAENPVSLKAYVSRPLGYNTIIYAISSNINFSQDLTLTSPNVGQTYIVGSTQPITWTYGPATPVSTTNVKLSYSLNGGTDSYPYIITDSTPLGSSNSGSYNWTIPDLVGSVPNANIKVKIEDVNNSSINAVSGAFTITIPTLTITAPNGSELWYPNEAKNITWTSSGTIADALTLQYSTDSGSNYNTINSTVIANSPQTYSWTLPFVSTSGDVTTAKVKISEAYSRYFKDDSAYDFNLTDLGNLSNIAVSRSGAAASVSFPSLFGVSPWTTLANTPASVVIGGSLVTVGTDTLYALGGSSSFWKYIISTNTWIPLENTPSAVNSGASLVAVGTDTLYALRGNGTDFWRYTISAHSWNTMPSVIGSVGDGGALVAVGTDLYAFRGGSTATFYKYTSSTGWSTLHDAPSTTMYHSSLVAVGTDTIYAFGFSSNLWRYTISNDTWVSLAPTFGGIRNGGALVSVGADTLYGFQIDSGNSSVVFLKYTISTNMWSYVASAPAVASWIGNALTLVGTNTLYAFRGNNTTDFWKYEISKETGWNSLSNAPAGVYYGGALTMANTDTLYALRGNNTTDFWRYTISTGIWSSAANTLASVGTGGTVVAAGASTLYALRGNNTTTFWKYTVSNNTWSPSADAPATVTTGVSLTAVGTDTLYALRGNGTTTFWKYTVSNNTWSPLADTLAPVGDGSALVAVGTDTLYAFRGGSSTFLKYVISTNIWSFLANTPANVTTGASLTAVDTDTLYASRGGFGSFCKYTISTNTWSSLTAAPASIGGGGALVAVGTNAVYTLGGNSTQNFWKYSPMYLVSGGGTYTSRVFDAGATSTWGTASWSGTNILPLGGNWQPLGSFGASTGQFNNPWGVFVDSINNKVYVAEYSNTRICKFDSGSGSTTLGNNWQPFGSNGSGTSQFKGLSSVFVDINNNKVYVADIYNNRIVKFDSGSGSTTLGSNWQALPATGTGTGAGTGQFSSPYGIFVDTVNNKVYVTEWGNNFRLCQFDSGSGTITGLGNNWQVYTGPSTSPFNWPTHVFADAVNNKVYVVDEGSHRIVKFDSGSGSTTLGNNWQPFGSNGSGTSQFNRPYSIFVDTSSNKAYVADSYNNRIVKFDSGSGSTTLGSNWQVLPATGTGTGAGTGQFNCPLGISVDTSNNKAYVADQANSRIVKFDSGGSGIFTLQARTGATTAACQSASWSPALTNGATLSGAGTGRYLQYLATISTGNPSVSPFLDNITFNYSSGATTISDDSDANFSIKKPILTFTTQPPASGTPGVAFSCAVSIQKQTGETITTDNSTVVTLTASGTGTLSSGTGTTFATVGNGVANFPQLYYSKPETITLTATSSPTATPTTSSPATNFGQALTLTSPAGGQSYTVGSTQTITWTDSKGIVSNVKLSYSTDGGSTYPYIIIDSTPDTGTYSWTVPDNVSATVKVKVEDANATNSYSTSTSNLAITAPTLTLTLPNGGEAWYPRESKNITWTSSGIIANNLKLEYSTDAGNSIWKLVDNNLSSNDDSSLVGYWGFNEGTGTTAVDSSGKGNTGAVSGAVWVDGTHGKALSFNGSSDYVDCGNNASLNMGTGAFSISLWFNSNIVNTNKELICKRGSSSGWIELRLSGSQVNFFVAGQSTSVNIVTFATVNPNTWYHVVGVYNPVGTSLIYLNGSANGQTSTTNVGDLSILNNNLTIGLGFNISRWNGLIDEVAIYNRALSAGEITTLYSGGAGTGFSGANSPQSYSWIVPFDVSDTVKGKISEAYSRYFKDDSNFDFGLGANSGTAVSGTGLVAGGVALLSPSNNFVPLANTPVGCYVLTSVTSTTTGKNYIYGIGNCVVGISSISRYDISTNTWSVVGTLPIWTSPSYDVLTAIGNTIYTIQPSGSSNPFYSYNIDTYATQSLGNAPTMYSGSAITAIGNTIYYLPGGNWQFPATTPNPTFQTFYKYTLPNGPWTALRNTPGPIYYGGALAAVGTDSIFVFQGNGTTNFWKYSIINNAWSSLPNLPALPSGVNNVLVAVGQDTLYALLGGSNLYKYTISTQIWSGAIALPSNTQIVSGNGVSLAAANTGTLYFLQGNASYNGFCAGPLYTSSTGTYTSRVFDAGATPAWGTVSWSGTNIRTMAPVNSWETFGTYTYGTGTSQFSKPASVFVDTSKNKVYVADFNNHRICKFDSGSGTTTGIGNNCHIVGSGGVDISNISSGPGTNQFAYPNYVFVDTSKNKVYVADSSNHRICKFDSGESPTTGLGNNWQTFPPAGTGSGTGTGQFIYPRGVFVNSLTQKVYVTQQSGNSIIVFDSGESPTTGLGNNWVTAPVGANNPGHVYVDTFANKVYFANAGSDVITKFDSGEGSTTLGANLVNFGSYYVPGAGINQFDYPGGVFVDTSANKVYVGDSGTYGVGGNRICKFDSGSGSTSMGANWEVLGGPATGTGTGQFNYPNGVFVDNSNNKVYVADYKNNRIVKFDSGGGTNTFLVQARTGANTSMTGATWTTLTSGQALPAGAGTGRYLQYLATMSTSNSSVSPFLDNITFNYNSGATTIFDTSDAVFSIKRPKLTFTQQPYAASAGVIMSPVKVTIQKQDGTTTITSDSSTQITLAASGGTTTLGGTLTVTVVNGVATFSDLIYNKSENITLTAVSFPVCTQAVTANVITVSGGTYNHLDVTGIADPIVAGTPSDVTVTVKDAYGNISTNYTGSITFSSSDTDANLPANFAFGDNVSTSLSEKTDTQFGRGTFTNPPNLQISKTGEPAELELAFNTSSKLNFNDSLTSLNYKDVGNTTADWDNGRGKIRLQGAWLNNTNLQACWLMDEASGNRSDSSGNNNTLSIVAAAGSNMDDRKQGDGSADLTKTYLQYLYILNPNSSLQITGADQPISISCWIKPRTVGFTQFIAGLADARTNKVSYWKLYINSSNNVVFALSNDGSTWNECIGATPLSAGSWYNIVATYDDTNIKIYVKGDLGFSVYNSLVYSAGICPWQANSSAFTVGYQLGTNDYFDGLIDELAIFKRSLSAAEASSIYNNGLASVLKYQSPAIAQSPKVNTTSDTIKVAKLSATQDVPAGTTLTYYLSNSIDAQSNPVWEQLASNQEVHTFSTTGNDLRWKAQLSATDLIKTPVISNVSIDYSAANIYVGSGTYISETKDLGSPLIVFSKIFWTQDAPSGTTVKFQIATNNDNATWDFKGSDPNNLSTSYYTYNALGANILSLNNTKRFIRFKAFLDSSDGLKTPVLKDVTITYNGMAGAQGTYTFSNAVKLKIIGEQWVKAEDIANPDVNGIQSNITVTTAPASKLAITSTALNQAAGVSGSVIVALQDEFGNNVLSHTPVTVNLTSNAASGVYKFYQTGVEVSAITIADGQDSGTFNYYQTTSGSPLVTATDASGGLTPVSQQMTINPLPASKIEVAGPTPATVDAGAVSGAFTITSKDPLGNIASVSQVTACTLSSGTPNGKFYSDSQGTQVITAKSILLNQSSATFFYKDTLSGAHTITATTASLGSASANIAVKSAAANYFVVIPNGNTTIATGEAAAITITAYDTYNNIAADTYAGSKTLVFSGANLSPSNIAPVCNTIAFGTNTPVIFTGGIGAGSLILSKAEGSVALPISIKATAAIGAIATSNANALNLVVKHADADHLKFSGNISVSGGIKAGVSFPLPALNAVDTYGNLCDDVNGATPYTGTKSLIYTLSKTNRPPGCPLEIWTGDNEAVEFSNGISTTALDTTLYYADNYTISVVSGEFNPGTPSNPITVIEGPVTQLKFFPEPSQANICNIALSQQPSVSVSDQYGNPVKSSSASIALVASLTSGVLTAVPDGHILTGDSLTVSTVNGSAAFSGIKYNYPEATPIYLKASAAVGNDSYVIYSRGMTFTTAVEGTVSAGALQEPAFISSVYNTSDNKLAVFDFKVTDAGSDSYSIKIKQVTINRSGSDATGDWTNYIAGASLFDGSKSVTGTVSADQLIFGSGTSTVFEVGNGLSKTCTLSIYLKPRLPEGADKKVIAFTINPNTGLTLDPLGSSLTSNQSALNDSLFVDVIASKFRVTGPSQFTAGESKDIYITAIDANYNVDADYNADKNIIFSGARIALSGDKPACNNVAFGDITPIAFVNGVSDTEILTKLFKAEGVAIKAADADNAAITTADGDDAQAIVSGGVPAKLSWVTQPITSVVANAPWAPFSVNVTDAYKNLTSSSATITLNLTGGNIANGAVSVVTAVGGIAAFNNFAAYCNTYPQIVAVNATANNVESSGASNAVTVAQYYDVTVKALDSVTGSALTEIALKIMDVASGLVIPLPAGAPNPVSGNSPFHFYLSYGQYNFNFNKDAYVETTIPKTPDPAADILDGTYDNKITWSIFCMSIAESLADYRVLSDFVYDEDNDRVSATVRLEKRGKQILSDSVNTLRLCEMKIYDSSDSVNPIYSASLPHADENGNYWITISNAVNSGKFGSGKSYFVKVTIKYGGESEITNVIYSAVNTFNIGVTARLKAWTAEIKNEVSGVKSTVSVEAAATRQQILSEAATTQGKVAEVKGETASILTATVTTLPDKITKMREEVVTSIKTEVKPHVQSGILTRNTTVKQGDTVDISYRTTTGLAPTVTVYDSKDRVRLSAKTMVEIGTSGVYVYKVKFVASWGTGEFNVVCTESTNGTVDALVMTVTQESLADVSGQVSAVLGSTSGISGLKNVTDTLNTQFNVIDSTLAKLSANIAGKVTETKDALSNLQSVFIQLESISKQIKGIGGTEGINLEKLYNVSKDKQGDVTYIKNKTQELKAAMDVNQKLMQNVANKPVVQTWFEFK